MVQTASILDHRLWGVDQALARYSLPIYCAHGKRAPTLVGTGFLLQVDTHTVIVTAAHVIEHEGEGELVIPGAEGFYRLPQMYRSCVKATSAPDFDVAFDVLHPVHAKALRRYAAVPVSWVDSNHIPDRDYVYTLIGFPVSRNKQGIRSNTIRGVVHRFHAQALDAADYEVFGLDQTLYLMLSERSLNIVGPNGRLRTPPSPYGISGCGIWCVGAADSIADGAVALSLVGIATRYIGRSRQFQGTRIALVLEALRDLFPSLSGDIPKSQYVQVDFVLE